jgi:uncharacterized protein (TIGR04255 family)
MSDAEGVFPAFERPPLEEVAIGVQFLPISNFYDAHAGLYWQRIKDAYPKVSSQPRIESPIESLNPPEQIRFEFPVLNQQQSRTWLISEDDEYLIQIQNTRFFSNWRHRQSSYPRFKKLRTLFLEHFANFGAFLGEVGLDHPIVQQVEISYINWVSDLPVERFFVPATATSMSLTTNVSVRIQPEDQSWGARYILESSESAVKRVYAQCQKAIRVQNPSLGQDAGSHGGLGEQGYQFALTFKAARSSGFNDSEIDSLVVEGRAALVPAFTELTTPEAHEAWGRYK